MKATGMATAGQGNHQVAERAAAVAAGHRRMENDTPLRRLFPNLWLRKR